jgi:hypothetical protein
VNKFKFFLPVHDYSALDDDITLTVYRKSHKDYKSVEIVGVSTTVFVFEVF